LAITNPTDDIIALLTNESRDNLARSILGELSFELTSFQVGVGGYQANPVLVEPINISATALIQAVGAKKDFVIIEQPIGPNVVAPVCRLNPNEPDVEFGLGELGVYGTYKYYPSQPTKVGTDFLFAVAHFPIMSKIRTHTFVWRIIVAL